MYARIWYGLILLIFASAYVGPTKALAIEQVDLELVFLADASGSIDDAEIHFQRNGYGTAITHPDVLNAIAKGPRQRIAVIYVEWGDSKNQNVVVPWSIIDGRESAVNFAEKLKLAPRLAYGRNAIGAALEFGLNLIESNQINGLRKVIDFSGDSANNWSGPSISTARDAVLAAGIVINGLAVLCRDCNGRPVLYDLEKAFAEKIIGGPASFVITAENKENFADAVRRKMILEISYGPDTGNRYAAVKEGRRGGNADHRRNANAE